MCSVWGCPPADWCLSIRSPALGWRPVQDPIITVASIGHPNARGARAYADAIAATLPTLGL